MIRGDLSGERHNKLAARLALGERWMGRYLKPRWRGEGVPPAGPDPEVPLPDDHPPEERPGFHAIDA